LLGKVAKREHACGKKGIGVQPGGNANTNESIYFKWLS
jgi:hypothetical protein